MGRDCAEITQKKYMRKRQCHETPASATFQPSGLTSGPCQTSSLLTLSTPGNPMGGQRKDLQDFMPLSFIQQILFEYLLCVKQVSGQNRKSLWSWDLHLSSGETGQTRYT
jgi:hypothetical protein